VPLIPHSDELGRLAYAPGNDHPRLSTGAALPTPAPTSGAPCRRSSTGAQAPAFASADGLRCVDASLLDPPRTLVNPPVLGASSETPGAPGTC
jgi:hypothetical protein